MNEHRILEAAKRIADSELRDKFLAVACEGNEPLKLRLEAALRDATQFSEPAATPIDPTHIGSASPHQVNKQDIAAQGLTADDALSNDNEAGAHQTETQATVEYERGKPDQERIGPYLLLKPIGEGGMGTVWLAEQKQPVRRRVAIKVIKAGMDTREVVQRFEAERQALAMMNHPNIAKVLDAGATDRGYPYFVMEWVPGIPITEYCDQAKLSTKDRLRLFCDICRAVQHAHFKGIIHRDLKPSNVLVMEVDGKPIVKVIDFGLAKAINQQLVERSLFTSLGQMVGTPAYMSPEQASGDPFDIDTRTDVYSLGVLLYELLTGVTPLDVAKLRSAGYAEMQRLIRELDPPRMSDRLSSLGADSSVTASKRSTDARRLIQLVRGDLDVIVMKSLEKDRNRRYDTPDSFAADLQRYLNSEVILARPASIGYKLQRFYARNQKTVWGAAAMAVTLVVATLFSARQAVLSQRSAVAATAAKQDAQLRLKQVERGVEILASIFSDLDLRRVDAEGATIENLIGEKLVDAGEQLTTETLGDPKTVGRLQKLLGVSLYSLANYEGAAELFRRAAENYASVVGDDDFETLAIRHDLAEALGELEQIDEAIAIHRDVLERTTRLRGEAHDDTIASLKDLGNLYTAIGDYDQGLPMLTEALQRARARQGKRDALLLTAMNSLAVGYQYQQKFDEALPLFEETLLLRREINGDRHYDTLTAINNLAACYSSIKNHARAVELGQEAFSGRLERLGAEHPLTLTSMSNLAVMLEAADRRDDALPLFQRSLEMSRATLGDDDPSTMMRISNLANCLRDLGQTEPALVLYREVVDRTGNNSGTDSAAYAGALVTYGFTLLGMQLPVEAEPVLRECLAIRLKVLPADDWRIASTQSLLGASLFEQGKLEEAEPLLISGYEGQRDRRAMMPINGVAGISMALERLIKFYETRMNEGDDALAEARRAERTDQ